MKYQVIYLTGAPASGKSTLLREMCTRDASIQIFEYGAELTTHLQDRADLGTLTQAGLRAKSSAIVTPEDVSIVDRRLLAFVSKHRATAHIIIDSHAVTRESYGFRVTPFSLADFASLAPTQIWVLFTEPEVAVSRVSARAEGRPLITDSQASMHAQLQASVAITYGMSVGAPVYFFEADLEPGYLANALLERLKR